VEEHNKRIRPSSVVVRRGVVAVAKRQTVLRTRAHAAGVTWTREKGDLSSAQMAAIHGLRDWPTYDTRMNEHSTL
jgi:hypothetical protein